MKFRHKVENRLDLRLEMVLLIFLCVCRAILLYSTLYVFSV